MLRLTPARKIHARRKDWISREMVKNVISFVPFQVLWYREGCLIPFVIVSEHLYDSVGVRKWQRTQQYSVYYTEDCCCGADAEGERKNGNDGETRTLPHHAKRAA